MPQLHVYVERGLSFRKYHSSGCSLSLQSSHSDIWKDLVGHQTLEKNIWVYWNPPFKSSGKPSYAFNSHCIWLNICPVHVLRMHAICLHVNICEPDSALLKKHTGMILLRVFLCCWPYWYQFSVISLNEAELWGFINFGEKSEQTLLHYISLKWS